MHFLDSTQNNPTNNEYMPLEKDLTVSQLYQRAGKARDVLRSTVRAIAREYSDRVHKLGLLQQRIDLIPDDGAMLGDVGKQISLSPDLEKLILNPNFGLLNEQASILSEELAEARKTISDLRARLGEVEK